MILMWIARGFVLLPASWACAWLRRQHSRRKARKQSRKLTISPMAGLTMGAMFLGLQAIVQPYGRHAIVELQEETDWDDKSDEDPPGGRAFHQGLSRIQSGEAVDALTVQLQPPPATEGTLNP